MKIMSDYVVKAGTTATLGKVDGGLKVGRNARIAAESGGKVVVTEEAYFEGPVTIDCDFECGSMRVEGRGYGPNGNVTVKGDLLVHGSADLAASVTVEGEVKADSFDVGGHLKSRSLVAQRVRVGGHMETRGTLEAETVDVGGHMTVLEGVTLADMRVGGHAKVGGGTISGEIKTRGHFATTKKLAYGHLTTYGRVMFPAGCNGESLTTHGRAEFEGDTSCKEMKVNGSAHVRGDCMGENVEVSGRLNVSGGLRLSKRLMVLGTVDVGRELECGSLLMGGKLVAEKASVGGEADLAGDVETTRGFKAESVIVDKGSKVTGPLVGGRVDIGKEVDIGLSAWGQLWQGEWTRIGRTTRVDDVHAKEAHISSNSQARHVFAEVVELEEGGMAYQVTYTKEVRLPRKYYLHDPPVKAERLPEPPL